MSSSSNGTSFSYNNIEVKGQVMVSTSILFKKTPKLKAAIACYVLFLAIWRFSVKTDSDLDAAICQWFRVSLQQQKKKKKICFSKFFNSPIDLLHKLLWVLNQQLTSHPNLIGKEVPFELELIGKKWSLFNMYCVVFLS